MRFRQLELEHTCTINGDDRLYVKISQDTCVYLDNNGNPQLRDKIHPGTIVLDGGKLTMPLESLNNPKIKSTIGPHNDVETMVRYRVMGEHGGKDIYRMVRTSQIDIVGQELGAVDIRVGAKKREIVKASRELHEEQLEHANSVLAKLAAIKARKQK